MRYTSPRTHSLTKNFSSVEFVMLCRRETARPVVGVVVVGRGGVDVVADEPLESVSVCAKSDAVESLATDVLGVGVEVAHDQDVVGAPASSHGRVDLVQGGQLLQHRVRVHVDCDQHQLRQR